MTITEELALFDIRIEQPFAKALTKLDKMLIPYWGECDDYGFTHTFVHQQMGDYCFGSYTACDTMKFILTALCGYDMIYCKQGYDNIPDFKDIKIKNFTCDKDKDVDHQKIWKQVKKCYKLAEEADQNV